MIGDFCMLEKLKAVWPMVNSSFVNDLRMVSPSVDLPNSVGASKLLFWTSIGSQPVSVKLLWWSSCSRWHHTLSTCPTIKAEGLLGEPSSGNSALRHACLCNQQLLTESWDYTIYIINPRTRPLRTIGSFCSMDRYLSMSILDFKVTLCLLYVRESRPILWQIAIDWSFSRHSLVSSGSNAGDMVDCCRTRI